MVVRAIDAGRNGIYLSVVNTDSRERKQVKITLNGNGAVTALALGASVARSGSGITLDLRPYQLLALRVAAP